MSWWQLDSILKERVFYAQYYRQATPVACPNDGEPLIPGPASEPDTLYCRFDGWRFPQDWNPDLHSGM